MVTMGDEILGAMKTAQAAKMLRGVLRAAVESPSDAAGGIGSVPCRASAALYFLLADHAVDRQGRCRSCWRPGAVFGLRRRLCRVHLKAEFWLRQPTEFLHFTFAQAASNDPRAQPRQTSAASALPQIPEPAGGIALTVGPEHPAS